MDEIKANSIQKISDELEGRVAGVLTRFFKDKKDLLKEIADSQKNSVDSDIVELSLATNALLFQLASLIVMLQTKTGKPIEDLAAIESGLLKTLIPIAKTIRDERERAASILN